MRESEGGFFGLCGFMWVMDEKNWGELEVVGKKGVLRGVRGRGC